MASPAPRAPWRWLLVLLLAGLLVSAAVVPGVRAEEDVDDAEDEGDEGVDAAAKEFEEGEGGGTEVVSTGGEVEEAEEEQQLLAASGVETTILFPGSLGKAAPTFRAGQTTEVLFGVSNEGSSEVKIAGVLAKLYVVYDYRLVAQNFTGELPSNVTYVNATVAKGTQASFAFHFTPNKLLQPMTFGLAATLFYDVEDSPHAAVLFNSTVEVLEPAGVVSGETVFLVLLGAGVVALLGMWASTQLESLSKRAKRSKKVETGTGEDADAANEWLQGTFFNKKDAKAGQAVKQRRRR